MTHKKHSLWATNISIINTEENQALAIPLYLQAVSQFADYGGKRSFAYIDSDEGRRAEDLMLSAVNKHAKECYGPETKDFRIEDCVDIWYYYLPKGTIDSGRELHNHPMSDFNAVFYLNPDEADVEFYDPRWPNNNFWFTRNNRFTVKPKSGDIVVFEGNLWHQTTAALLQSHRVCVVSNWSYPRPYMCAPLENIAADSPNKQENVPYFNRLKHGLIKPSEYAKNCTHLLEKPDHS
jgi:hypothetical protein